MQFAFFYPKVIQKCFWKTIDFVENLGSCSLSHYDAMHAEIDL